MKKLLLIILTFTATFAFNNANAQWCGTVNNTITDPSTPAGFPIPDSIACATQGTPFSVAIPFKMYAQFNYIGVHDLDSITIVSINNLPCGLCWSLNKASNTYAANEFGSLNITGTTHDAVGQYNLRLTIKAYLSSNPGVSQTITPNTVDAAGIKIWLRVTANGTACVSVDTSQNGVNQVAATTCPTGINEVAENVSSVNVMPNPMNSGATLSFAAEKNAAYSMKITDVTGKVVSVKEIAAIAGMNTTTIERGNLSAGIYIISLTDGVSSVTKKLSIAE